MNAASQEPKLFREERLAMHQLLANNPNYFGTVPDAPFPVVQPIEVDTSYEELTCVGLWPERNLLEATLVVKLPFGFLGGMCSIGSYEYIRFFIDWDNDGDFDAANEDVGVAFVNVHDIPQVEKHHLCYAVRLPFRPFLADCHKPYIVKVRAILSWDVVPPAGNSNFIPIWGNVLDCWIQIDPVEGKILEVVVPSASAADVPKPPAGGQRTDRAAEPPSAEKERIEFLELLKFNPNYFGTLSESTLEPVQVIEYNTRYEELNCIGLYPEENFLEAVLEVKLPFGFLGDLCSQGSYEYVRFFIDWNGDGDFVDFNEDAGVAAVRVHDIPEVQRFHLCYALGRHFPALRSKCQSPFIVKVRAILSWQQVPTGPNFIPVWGNMLECWVQVNPTEGAGDVLIGEIDTPIANACVGPTLVPACLTDGAPLVGIQITGSAGGSPFHHYTLRYSWGLNPPINDAVVYPDCSRPPANSSYNVPVFNGTLGYLDVALLPPGVTEFTIYLDVHDAAASVVSVSRIFKLRTTAVQITAAATVNALEAEDPFHPGFFTKLVKATNNASITVPELSIGGAFSITGSAYVVGCDRIMSQFNLVDFAAPPASPVPNFPNALGGAPVIPTPVVYDGTSAHPWQSGCFPVITPNIILNGDLVAQWSVDNCHLPFPPFTAYSIPKVKPLPFWNSSALNGRYVILVEVRDVPVGPPGPSAIAGVDQVVVWIDNRIPAAVISSVGGLGPCADLHLKDYVGTTAEIRGVAWDPPIDPTAPQHPPNDNFGSYGLSFQKDGGVGGGIPAATPNSRVPNVWPMLLPGATGTLANWDIVNALDASSPTPTPGIPAAAKLTRGERCAYLIALGVTDATYVGDSGDHHTTTAFYAITIINDIA